VWEIACWILLVCDVLGIKLEFEKYKSSKWGFNVMTSILNCEL